MLDNVSLVNTRAVALNAIGVVSSNIPRSIEFFTLLGISFPTDGSCEASADHTEAVLPSGLRLMLDSESLVRSLNPNWDWPPENSQTTLLAFDCVSPTNVDAVFQLIVNAGFTSATDPWDAFWGQRYAQVRDQDGNTYDLFADLTNE
jgi:uncharacterized glyoxalase superfamily protein PhnB